MPAMYDLSDVAVLPEPGGRPAASRTLAEVASGIRAPRVFQTGNLAFQVTRGLLGTSM